MKRAFVICLAVLLLAAPVALFAEDGVTQKPPVIQDDPITATLHDDIVAMRNDLERLSGEVDSLSGTLRDEGQKEAALKLQEHVSSLIQRTREMEKKIDAESGGAMASFKEGQAVDGKVKSK